MLLNHKILTGQHQLSFAKNKTVITKVADGLAELLISVLLMTMQKTRNCTVRRKRSWQTTLGTGYKYDAAGNKVINADGTYALEVGKEFGSALPDFTGGLYNTFTYKGLSLSAAIDFQKGGSVFLIV